MPYCGNINNEFRELTRESVSTNLFYKLSSKDKNVIKKRFFKPGEQTKNLTVAFQVPSVRNGQYDDLI